MLRNRFITSALSITALLPLLSCGANVCFTGSSPQIISVTPGTVITGSSPVQVTIVGSNFSDGTVITFNDGTQIVPATVTPSRMTVFFAASFFNGVLVGGVADAITCSAASRQRKKRNAIVSLI